MAGFEFQYAKLADKMICWSYGGGWQSVCIGVLVREGALPVPDLAAIVDTGREHRATWTYMNDYMLPYLKPIGLNIEIVPHSMSRVDLYSKDGGTVMPAYTAEGRLGAFCSGEWKRDTMERWLRSKGVKECTQWIGYSMDELARVKNDHRPWLKLEYPLIEKWINRAMIPAIIQAAGLPLPRKSRCYCCPHQSDAEWQEIHDDPVDWPLAVAVDNEVRENDPQKAGLYLYSGRVPLEMADFKDGAGIVPPGKLCETGNCWT